MFDCGQGYKTSHNSARTHDYKNVTLENKACMVIREIYMGKTH